MPIMNPSHEKAKALLDSGMKAMREMRRAEAEQAFRQAVERAEGDERLHARALARLLYALASQGRAHELARTIADAARANLARGTDEVAALVLQSCFLRFIPVQHPDSARVLAKFAAQARKRPQDLDVARAAAQVAIVSSDRGDHQTAAQLLEAAAPVLERELGARDAEYALVLFNLADVRAALAGSYEGVLPMLRRAIAIQEAALDAGHFERVMPLATLGLALVRGGKPDEGRAALESALEIAVAIEGIDGRTPQRIRAELGKLTSARNPAA